jgi:hypothetical protein
MDCPCGGVCACHIGGAWRPACNMAGGCGTTQPAGPKPDHQCRGDGCDRPRRPGQEVCGRCFARLARALEGCLDAWRWLGAVLGDGSAGAQRPRVSGSPSGRLPIDADRAEQRTLIRSTVDGWARVVAEANRVQGPFAAGGPSQPIEVVCRWLGGWLPWIARQPFAPTMLADLSAAAAGGWRLAPTRGRAFDPLPLPCPGCDHLGLAFFADTRMVECRSHGCDTEMSYARYRELVSAAAAALADAPDAEPGLGDPGGGVAA